MLNRITLHVSESKSHKAKKERSPRAIFYSQLMKNLGGETGDNLGEAFTKGETEKFRTLMTKLCDKMEEAEHGKKLAESK
jgi:hypothetical protein